MRTRDPHAQREPPRRQMHRPHRRRQWSEQVSSPITIFTEQVSRVEWGLAWLPGQRFPELHKALVPIVLPLGLTGGFLDQFTHRLLRRFALLFCAPLEQTHDLLINPAHYDLSHM